MLQRSYRYPAPRETVASSPRASTRMRAELDAEQDKRIAGLGIAMPFELWNWADTAGAPRGVMDEWRHRDIRAEIQAQCAFPVYLQNDATSACGAELVFGQTGGLRDFVYFYIGAFAGGGIVLNGSLYGGRTGNAGALGSMPVPGAGGKPTQLIDVASIAMLEKALNARGIDGSHLWTSPEDWGEIGADLDALDRSARRRRSPMRIVAAVLGHRFRGGGDRRLDAAGGARRAGRGRPGGDRRDRRRRPEVPAVREGTVGIHARALGGASLPLSERFLIGANLLSKAK